jgi:hypothetical protein
MAEVKGKIIPVLNELSGQLMPQPLYLQGNSHW